MGGRVGQRELGSVFGRTPGPARLGRGRWEAEDTVRTQPAHQLHRQISQQERQPGHVVPGVEDDQDGRVAGLPVPGLPEPGDHLADLLGGDRGEVIIRAQADRVQ